MFLSVLFLLIILYVPQTTFGDLLFAGSVTGDNLLIPSIIPLQMLMVMVFNGTFNNISW